ncbi:MAG: kinase [Solirubrobacteraceae bacterium]|nr:kinase [Solirubrobacteraceae bacterium]MEA2275504.1 kinase [Solirubrobacteraceae bacterium]
MTGRARTATVLTHSRPAQTREALEALILAAQREGVVLRFDGEETRKFELEPRDGLVLDAPLTDDVELCVVLGGDGTILRALRRYAGTSVPVFAVNYGEVGFLATVDPEDDDLSEAFERALAGDFEILTLPALALETPDGPQAAINDLSIHRRAGERVAQLAYAIDGEEVGSVRCDGLVLATPAGSTGYNLANGGPVLAWGVEGFVVSFIAPHSLTARALVVAPGDLLSVHNRSHGEVDISLDGRPAGTLDPGDAISASFLREAADLAQVPGSSFYRRLREKFGRLAS